MSIISHLDEMDQSTIFDLRESVKDNFLENGIENGILQSPTVLVTSSINQIKFNGGYTTFIFSSTVEQHEGIDFVFDFQFTTEVNDNIEVLKEILVKAYMFNIESQETEDFINSTDISLNGKLHNELKSCIAKTVRYNLEEYELDKEGGFNYFEDASKLQILYELIK